MSMLEYVPIPYFLVDTEFNILEWSQQSGHLFKPSANFLDLVDVFSQEKARKFLSLRQKDSRELSVDEPHDEQTLVQSRGQAIQKVELVMQTNDSPR
jgi:rsbT co-antagonist protein RsbR